MMLDRGWMSIPVEDLLIRYEKEGWVVECTWPRRGRADEVKVIMSVRYLGIGGGPIMAKRRVNIRSGSQTGPVVVMMNKMVENTSAAKTELSMDFQVILEDINHWYERGHAIQIPDPTKVKANQGWMVYPVWPASGITGVAAAPGSFKSYMAQAVALGLHHGTPLLQQNTTVKKPRKVLYLDWEEGPDTFAERLGALQRGSGLDVGPGLAYKKMNIGLGDSADSLRDAVADGEYEGIIVDSMSASIAGEMTNDDSVNAFYDAIHGLGIPALVLAHKSIANIESKRARFFGSGMSEARVRMAWNAEVTAESDKVLWECFKDNNHGLRGSKLGWEVEFESKGKKDARRIERVSFVAVNPESVDIEKAATNNVKLTRADQIALAYLTQGPMDDKALARHMDLSEGNVRKIRHDNRDRFYQMDDGKWNAVPASV